MTGCVLRYGFSKYAGGAMYLNGNSATIKNCTFTYNFGGFEGGAISAAGGALDVSDSIFSHNTAESGGAGAAIGISGDASGTSVACVVTVRRCSFFANDGDGALSAGGASAVSMHECSLVENSAATAGAVRFSGHTLLLEQWVDGDFLVRGVGQRRDVFVCKGRRRDADERGDVSDGGGECVPAQRGASLWGRDRNHERGCGSRERRRV
jgi:hypothetical protein